MNKGEKKYCDAILNISDRFNRNIFKFIRTAEVKRPNNSEITRLKKIISVGKSIDATILIKECEGNIWKHREKVYNRDIKFLSDPKLIAYTQQENYSGKKNSDLIFKLSQMINDGIKTLTSKELNYLWELSDNLVKCVCEYRALTLHGYPFYHKYFIAPNKK